MPVLPLFLLALWLGLAPTTAAAGATSAMDLSSVARVTDLRGRLTGRNPADPLTVRGVALLAPALLTAFYAGRNFAPIWAPDDTTHGRTVTALLQAFEQAREHGLDPQTYRATQLEALQREPAATTDLELLATDAFLRHALHRAHGRLQPEAVDPEWHLFVTEVDPAMLLGQLADGVPLVLLLDDLWPTAPQYWALLEEKRRLATRRGVPHPLIGGGPLLRPGDRGQRVAALRTRLGLPAEPHSTYDLFDASLEAAVRQFQQDQGLAIDGVVGANTVELLDLSDAARRQRIDINLERWRWLMRTLPATRIQVNVADFALQVIEDGTEALRMNVIVGTPFRRTPVFTEDMRYLVFNPYWNVPRRIAVQDKLPLLHRDPTAMAALGYEAQRGSVGEPALPVDAFDWTTVTARSFDFRLRQRPGPNNALGQVKFILPNTYSIYLHDTPTRDLFARSGRAFSSGCIRLEHALVLVDWVLRDQPQWTRARIDAVLAAGEPVEVPLLKPVPVLLLYFTAVAGASGTVYYRPDHYGRDRAIAAALGAD